MSNVTKFIDQKQYHKSNYDKALNYIIPKLYYEEDYKLQESEIDILDKVINSHLNIIQNITNVINVSSIPGSLYEGINTAAGIAPFFIKQNNLTDIDLSEFEKKILIPLGTSVRNFNTSDKFSEYLLTDLLPGIVLNNPTKDFLNGGTPQQNHTYLITNLNWLYFLNTSGGPDFSPSTIVHDILVNVLYQGNTVLLNDCIKGLTEYIWRNYVNRPLWQNYRLLPNDFRPPPLITENSYTEGDQQLDRLKTLVDVVYSPLFIDNGDTRVKDAVFDFLENSYTLQNKTLQGPFTKLIKAFSFGFADYSNYTDRLQILYDLDKCPDEFIPKLADLIGWKLFGSDAGRWRLQIANAVNIYKRTGTRQSLQYAINSLLPRDLFDLSGSVTELWESYIPNLIYYALATESVYFKDFTTLGYFWSNIANRANTGQAPVGNEPRPFVWNYNGSSLDENIRSATDRFIYDLVLQFRQNFRVSGEPFPIGDPNFLFIYRNAERPIPPFEEYPYYIDTHVNFEMVDAIKDKLVCYGVPVSFADKVSDYIKDNCLLATDDIRSDNTWLMFTSSINYPPNWDSIIEDISNGKSQYLSLWSGKSSHFKVMFKTDDFDFAKDSLDVDSRQALSLAAQMVKEFSPAHSIPIVTADIEATDSNEIKSVQLPLISFDKPDYSRLNIASGISLSRYGLSATVFQNYKRGIATGYPELKRDQVDSIADPLLYSNNTALLPRRDQRRRNFKFTLPKDGFYTKTGFNMPVSFENRCISGSYVTGKNTAITTFLPLGLIPSSQSYVPITNYNDIPSIYSNCETLSSSSIYSGLAVSNTFPCRGWRGLGSNAKSSLSSQDRYFTYGELPEIIAVMHYIKEQAKLIEASSYYSLNSSKIKSIPQYINYIQSYANSSTKLSGNFPNSMNDYTDFSFGREFHKLYNEYTHTFNRHRLNKNVLRLDGPTIFAHTFGSIIRNSNFKEINNLNYVTRENTNFITIAGSSVFSPTANGCYVASSNSDCYIQTYELRNSGIINQIELCQTSGVNESNSFSIIKLDTNSFNPILKNNVIIRQTHSTGFGRLRFDISKYSNSYSDGYDVTSNFLSPDHDFKLTFKTLISNRDVSLLGGHPIAVWIHTKPEDGKIWSYVKNIGWVQHSATLNNIESIEDYTNITRLDIRNKSTPPSGQRFICAPNDTSISEVAKLNSLYEEDYYDIEISFNTRNRGIKVPVDYLGDGLKPVHRLDQNYVIEIMPMVFNPDKFILYYNLNLMDLTLNKWSKPLILSNPTNYLNCNSYCKEYRVDLDKNQLFAILKYFNSLAGAYNNFGYASRIASQTSGVFEVSGGSRLNYVQSPDWYDPIRTSLDPGKQSAGTNLIVLLPMEN